MKTLRRSAPALLSVAAAFAQVEFKADVRLVEVYATVVDHKGRYVSGLAREQFRVADNGRPQPIAAFESSASALSCAILLDTTGSMARAMPVVKNAILRLIDRLREGDSAAVYGFSTRLAALQDFTADKSAAKRALLATRPAGTTALFDALSNLSRDLARLGGKKVVVAFTDGADNASVLHAAAAVEGAKKAGLPVYAVAQGEALQSVALLKQLREIAQATGGRVYAVREAGEVEEVFQAISRELASTYLIAYRAPESTDGKWRSIRVTVPAYRDYRVRAKDGYLPQ